MSLCVYKYITHRSLQTLERHVQNYQRWLSLGSEIVNKLFLLCFSPFTMNIYFFCTIKKQTNTQKNSVKPTLFRAPQALDITLHVLHVLLYAGALVGYGPQTRLEMTLWDLISDLNPSQIGSIRNTLYIKFHLKAKAMTMTLQALVICTYVPTSICPHVLLMHALH